MRSTAWAGGGIFRIAETADVWTNGMIMVGTFDVIVEFVQEITIVRFTVFSRIVILLLILG